MFFNLEKVPLEIALVSVAFLLCSLIGLERQFQHKAAGIRTHALVGIGSCIFTLISVEGFVGLAEYQVTRDPSRISAQIVSGIGFLGAGVIFVNRDVVRGLTTAASIWLAAAIGMACGAGMIPMAIYGTVLHFVAIFVVAPLSRLIPLSGDRRSLYVTYEDGRGVLRDLLARSNELGCETSLLNTRQETLGDTKVVRARMRFRAGPPMRDVMAQLAEVPGVVAVDPYLRDDDEL